MALKSKAAAKRDASIKPIQDFKGIRSLPHPADRLAEIRKKAARFRDKLSQDQVTFYKTYDLVRVPYPVRYGLLNASSVFTPYMHIVNRLFIVQYRTVGSVKTLLFSPSDIEGNRETPFFKRMGDGLGPFKNIGQKFLAPILGSVEECLADAGIRPEQVDYISYDHLHTQELRKWLGADGSRGYFPNAKLLVMRQEWDSTQALLPPQIDWYCPNGTRGVNPSRIVKLDGDVMLGEGVALIHTPGHTEGNHSLAASTPDGVLVSSENGVCADSYAPLQSRIPGVRKYAQTTGMEVILNGNTLEMGLGQYVSMVQEKEIAGPSPNNKNFTNVVPSSELASYWGFPGLSPTFTFGPLTYGRVAT